MRLTLMSGALTGASPRRRKPCIKPHCVLTLPIGLHLACMEQYEMATSEIVASTCAGLVSGKIFDATAPSVLLAQVRACSGLHRALLQGAQEVAAAAGGGRAGMLGVREECVFVRQ